MRHEASLVHESVRGDSLVAARHRAFIVSRLAGAALSTVALLIYVIAVREPATAVVAALACMILPAGAAVVLMRTGALDKAHLMSALMFVALVAGVAAVTGGLKSFVIAWMLVVPVEAAMSGSRNVVATVVIACLAALGGLSLAQSLGHLPVAAATPWNETLVFLLGVGGALLYGGMMAATIEHHYGMSESVVHNTEARYRLLAENATDMITRHGPNGDVRFVSGAAHSLVDCMPQLLLSGGLAGLVHMDDREVYGAAFRRAASTGRPATVEFRLARDIPEAAAQPDYRWVELNCRAVTAPPDGDARELVAVTRDISGRKRRQEELRLARDAAEQASRAKSHFLANMSHELRTPLNSVIGFAELLERELKIDPRFAAQGEYASMIRQSGQHLLGVVNDLLDLSRIEAGHFSLNPEAVDLNEVVRYCHGILERTAEESGVAVVTQHQEDELVIEADRKACIQIVLNLLSNAIKFSQAGGRVMISTRSDGVRATIAVRDHGIGIAPELINRLGQPFMQGDDAYNRVHEGAGLGLSIVKGLVKGHAGDLHIESTQGMGTCVTVTLPTCAAAASMPRRDAKGAAMRQALPSII